jgi:hypothetical protein
VPGSERIVRTFIPVRESAQAAAFTVVPKGFFPARENLVRVGLVPHIEYELVVRSVEYIVQTGDEFHRTEAGRQVAGIAGAAFDDILPDLLAEVRKLFLAEFPQVRGRIDIVQDHRCEGTAFF